MFDRKLLNEKQHVADPFGTTMVPLQPLKSSSSLFVKQSTMWVLFGVQFHDPNYHNHWLRSTTNHFLSVPTSSIHFQVAFLQLFLCRGQAWRIGCSGDSICKGGFLNSSSRSRRHSLPRNGFPNFLFLFVLSFCALGV